MTLFVLTGLGDGATDMMIPAIFTAEFRQAIEGGADPVAPPSRAPAAAVTSVDRRGYALRI